MSKLDQELSNGIKEFEGHVETCTNRKDETIVWKVVPSHSVTEDDFEKIRKNEKASVTEVKLPVGDADKHNNKDDCSKSFWALWPTDIDEDIIKLNDAIKLDTIKEEGELPKSDYRSD